MAVTDLWHKRGERVKCPLCGQLAGPPSARHGRGLRWRVAVPGHPSESYREKGRAERREVALWATPEGHLAPRTQEAAREAAAVVEARWAGVRIADVQHDDVQAWISGMRTARGPASSSMRHKALQCLRGSLAIAVRRGLIPANPADDVSVPKIRPREGRFLTVDEVGAIASAASEHARALGARFDPGRMIWFMGTTAARIGETCRLDVGHVDPARKRVRIVDGKGGKSRSIPLTDFALGLLDLDRPPSEPLFPTPRTGARQRPTPWRRGWFQPAVEAVGLGGVRPHDLRHTAVSLAIHAGASIYDVQQMCGHSRPSTTLNIYGHLLDGHLDDVAARMDRLLGVLPGKSRG